MLLFSDFICITNQRTVKAAPQSLRVGYIDYANFIETEIDGSYSGYGVDYLNEISKKTGWKYDYVFDTWPNLLARLQSGDIDLIASAQYSEDRAATFDFSNTLLGKNQPSFTPLQIVPIFITMTTLPWRANGLAC